MNDQSTGYMELVEALAALEHRQWMHWTQSLAEREDPPDHLVERWEENWVPYDKLDDETKDHGRAWAKVVVELLNEHDVCEIVATEETGDVSGLHPNPQMQKYQLLAAGETVDLVYFGDGDASLLEAESATLREGWVDGRDSGGKEISYPSRRVEYVHHNFEIPEIETAEDQSADTDTIQSKDGDQSTNDIEWQVEKRTLVQLSSIERMLRDDVASNEAIADVIQDCREELECAVNTGADQSEDGDQS